ncbi:efflux RND transporter periplasmic adaptor subunit [Lysobacter niabensis]|uniref:efflux RND transporter periplasmic adaptor subunit n=1 Tax=Agrilutibacter niabensis TaxID=380628 RepID=UPI00361F8630
MRKPAWLGKPTRPLYLLLAGALIALAAWGFWPRAVLVDTAEIVRAPLTVAFAEEGRTRLRDRYLVSAPLDGMVERIVLEPGDAVKAGESVAMLLPANAALFDPATRSAAEARWRAAGDELDAATAAAAAASALRDRLEAARRRTDALANQQLISSDQRDEIRAQATAAEANLHSAQARARAARIQRDMARSVLDLQGKASRSDGNRLRLSAPIDGQVIRRFVESEGFVRAGQSLLELGDPQALEVIVEALTEDAMRIGPGTRVELLRWGGDTPLPGRVQTIEPGGFTKFSALGVEEQRVLVVVALDDAGKSRPALGDGFRVEAQFRVWGADDVLTVPVAALFRDGTQWAVYAIENKRARLRHLQIGHVGEDQAEVRGGLAAGSRVVLYPGDSLRDGMRVKQD